VRVLFASTRGAGHFNPLIPFIEACLRGGHEVMVAGPPPLADAVERAGYPFWEGAEPPPEELGPVWARVPTVSREEAEAIVLGEIFGYLNVRAMLPSLSAACEQWRPDAVVREQAEFASAIAAERQGIPHARLGVMLASAEETALTIAGSRLDEQEPGVTERIRASPYLTLFPASLEDPDGGGPPITHRFRDPAAGASTDALPDWWPGDERPLVYVSFGSVAGGMPTAVGLFQNALEAAGELPARVLVTVGRELEVEALGPAPPNVRIESWVPQAEVLGQAGVVVGHGGSGTTLGTLAAGVPLVVVPLFADQPENARRVAEVGAGVAVWPNPDAPPEPIRSSIDPAALRRAVEEVLGEPSYRRVAEGIAAEMAALPPTDEALAAIGLTAGR
jgi:UDP:flavonoid glycosyltransferase YjiC (YdhE family)